MGIEKLNDTIDFRCAMSAIALCGLTFAEPALAQCFPSNPADGAVVTCTGIDADGFDFENADDIALTVNSGATINNAPGDNEAVRLGADANILVQSGGTIFSDGEDAVQTEDNLQLNISGTIRSEAKDGINANNNANVILTSSGLIEAEDGGIQGDDFLTVTNHGTIITTGSNTNDKSNGVQAGDSLTVANLGTITAIYEGINADDQATVVNSGTITGINDAIKTDADAAITNSGLIENVGTAATENQDAIDIDSGNIVNLQTGVIRSTRDAAIDFDAGSGGGTITNRGTIIGTYGIETDVGNTGSQQIINSGLIQGTAGISLNLRAGRDLVTLNEGGRFIGNVNLGRGRDVFTVGTGSFGDLTGNFIVNGGDGNNDKLNLSAYSILDDRNVTQFGNGGIYDISMSSDSSDIVIRFTGFEFFSFRGITISYAELMRSRVRK